MLISSIKVKFLHQSAAVRNRLFCRNRDVVLQPGPCLYSTLLPCWFQRERSDRDLGESNRIKVCFHCITELSN